MVGERGVDHNRYSLTLCLWPLCWLAAALPVGSAESPYEAVDVAMLPTDSPV